jgi:putative transposase
MPRFRRFTEGDYCYFVTTSIQDPLPLLRDARLCQILRKNLQFYRDRMKFGLHGYVIMPDHVHLLITPRQPATISDIMRNFKSYTSKGIREALGIRGPIWQRRFHDRVIRSEDQFRTALDYIHLNPVQAGLVQSARDYAFSSYRFWEEGDALLPLDALDGRGWGRDLRQEGSRS